MIKQSIKVIDLKYSKGLEDILSNLLYLRMKNYKTLFYLIFVHIPKTMGTTLNAWFGYSMKDSKPNLDFLYGQYNGRQLQHLKYSEIKELIDPEYFVCKEIFS